MFNRKSLFVAAALIFCLSASAEILCQNIDLGPQAAEILVGDRHIFILGWEHMGDREADILIGGFDKAVHQATAGDCTMATQTATATIDALRKQVDDSIAMTNSLRAIDKVAYLKNIAVEMTPTELRDEESRWSRIHARAAQLEKFCGEMVKQSTSSYSKVVPGPEFNFLHADGSQVVILAPEDEKIKAENAKDFEPDGQDEFDFGNPKIKYENRLVIKQMSNMIASDQYPSEELIAAVVTFETDPTAKAKLLLDLHHSIARVLKQRVGMKRRNVAIATNLLKANGNIAMPIGWAHLDHLKYEILRQCQQKSQF